MTDGVLRNCAWGYKCEKKWEGLERTSEEKIRFCKTCQKQVHQCLSKDEFVENIHLNRCVYFNKSFLNDSKNIDKNEVEKIADLQVGLAFSDYNISKE